MMQNNTNTYNNEITYCELKNSFGENGLKNKKTINAYEYATWMLETNRRSSRYEIIQANKLAKLYFDIEKLPISENTNHKMIYEIRDAIANFFQSRLNRSIGSCIITHNKGSDTHPGASYHLIFDQTISYTPIMREFVKEFVEKHPQYSKYIDCSVYSKNRLFKSAYNIGIDGKRRKLSSNPENFHYFLEEKQVMETLLRSIITFIPIPSKCFEIKGGIFKAQHSDSSFFAKISASDEEDTTQNVDTSKKVDVVKTEDDNVKVSNTGDKIDYTPYENLQQQKSDSVQLSFTVASISEIVNKNNTTKTENTIDKSTIVKTTNDKKEKECSYEEYNTPDRYENLPPTTSQILFDECSRQTSLEEAANVISPLISEIEDRIWKRIDEMCDHFKMYKEDDDVKFCKWDIGHQLFDDKHTNLIRIAHALENYRSAKPLYKDLTKHYDLLVQCFQLYPCGQSKQLTFELFLACVSPSRMGDVIDTLNTFKKSTILLMFKFIDYITQYLHTTFDNLFIKCEFIRSFLVDQTLHVLDYYKMLEICERFDTIDELECVNPSKSRIYNNQHNNQNIYNQCICDRQYISQYFSQINKIVKQIISNPKYTEKQLTLEDFFEK